jgi:hypothetical protein
MAYEDDQFELATKFVDGLKKQMQILGIKLEGDPFWIEVPTDIERIKDLGLSHLDISNGELYAYCVEHELSQDKEFQALICDDTLLTVAFTLFSNIG